MIEQQATLKAEKWATTHLFSRSAPNLRDSRRLISSGSLSLFLSACDVYWSVISRDLYALALSNCCSPAAGALYYDDVSAAAAASQEKRGASRTSFMSPVIYVVHQPLYVLLLMMLLLAPIDAPAKQIACRFCICCLLCWDSSVCGVYAVLSRYSWGEARNKLCFIQFVTLTARDGCTHEPKEHYAAGFIFVSTSRELGGVF